MKQWMVEKWHEEDWGYRDAHWETIGVKWPTLWQAQAYAREVTRIGHDARIIEIEVVETFARRTSE